MSATADRVRDTTTTTGTGNITLAGSAPSGFRTFASAFGASATIVPYAIVGGAEWEIGWGELTGSTTLIRTRVLASSNAGALVTFSAGSKDVFATVPAHFATNPYQVTLDFGTSAVYAKQFVITTVPVIAGIKVIMTPSGESDEYEMDGLICAAKATNTDEITAYVRAVPGPVSGNRTFNLFIG